jgi:hypothetical protein
LTLIDYDASSNTFYLNYLSNPKVVAPTLIVVPSHMYTHGYCARTSAGLLHQGTDVVEVSGPRTITTVEVTVIPGQCPRR